MVICFNRWGKLGLLVKASDAFQDTQVSNMTDVVSGVVAQFNAESDIQAQMGSQYIGLANGPGASFGAAASTIAELTANRVVFRDNPRIAQNLQQLALTTSLQEITRQMVAAGASILAMTIGASPSGFTGTGNGTLNASTKRALDGRVQENAFAESVLVTCSQDSYTGGATQGNESFRITGSGSQDSYFAFDWPLGSNAEAAASAIDGDADNASGNILTNSGFASWTGGAPDDFTINTGAGLISQETVLVYSGASAMKITGDGSTLVSFQQEFGADTGGALAPLTQYSLAIFMRRDGVAPAAGTILAQLIDADTDAVIADAAAVSNSSSVDLTALTTSYLPQKVAFRTPAILPERTALRLVMGVALTTGRAVYLAKMGLGEMTQHYVAGCSYAIHSGSVPFVLGDFATAAVSNSRGAAGVLATWQTLLARLFPTDAYQNGLLFPSSNAPTISDALIG